MSSGETKEPRRGGEPRGSRRPLRVEVTPAAAERMRAALEGKTGEYAIRLFVGGGAHPAVGMSVDRVSERDERLEVAGVSLAIDSGSRPFLDEARVDFVVTGDGEGFSVTGPNTPGAPPPAAGASPADGSPAPTEFADRARAALKSVYDPEIPMNIVDLGLIYGAELAEGGAAHIRMTMTTPGCPVIEMLLDQVRHAVEAVPGVTSVDVEIVWDPPWGPEKMTEFARRQLGFA